MDRISHFEVVEDDVFDYLAVHDLTATLYLSIEGNGGRYVPIVYESDGVDNVDSCVRVAMSEPCKTPEHAAEVCFELAAIHYRLRARAAELGPLPTATVH